MKKRVAVVGSKRPNWQRKILSNAIAMAGAGLQASAVMAAPCPATITSATAATCELGPDGTITINAAPAGIVVGGGTAIQLTGVGDKSITNSGTLTGFPAAIQDQLGVSSGHVTVMNNANAAINGFTAGIWINSLSTITVTNAGTIKGSSSSSAAGIYVSGDLKGSVDNSGTITGIANGTSETAFNSAAGIGVAGDLAAASTITNTGTISGHASISSGTASAAGIFISGNMAGTISNNGTTSTISGTATASGSSVSSHATAAGIFIGSDMLSTATITNAGTISGSATASSGHALAGGIAVLGTSEAGGSLGMSGTINNTGTISGTATGGAGANAAGIFITSNLRGSVVNGATGNITGTATSGNGFASAFGIILVNGGINSGGDIDNQAGGQITATATGTSASAVGIAMSSGIAVGSTLTNAGTISASVTATNGRGTATGVGYGGGEGLDNTNTGKITVTAAGSSAFARGVEVFGALDGTANLSNSGSIDVTATATSEGFARATGISVATMSANSTLTNSGTITVTADGAEAFATGIFVQNLQAGATLTNVGTITRFGESGSTVGGAGINVQNMAVGATLINNGTISADSPAGIGTGWAIIVGGGSSEGGFPIVTNAESGVLRGNVSIQGSLNNSGLLSIPVSDLSPQRTSFVAGNYTQTGVGRFEIGALDMTHYGRMQVDGTADLTANGRLGVIVAPNDHLVAGGILDNVLHATTLLSGGDANLSVVDNSAFWDFSAVDDGEGGIDLVIAEHTVPVLAAQSVQVANVNLDELSSVVMGRMDTRRLLAARGSHDQNLWFRPYGTTGTQDDDNGVPGYDIDTYGMVIGYDSNITDEWNAGAAFAYSKADIKSKGLFNDKVDTDFYQGAVYAYFQGAGHQYIDLMAIYGTSSNDSSRDLGNGGSADGNYDGWYTRLSSAIGKGFPLSDSITLTPSASVSYTYVKEDGYKESGAGGSNLNVDSNDASSLIFGLDGQISFSMGKGSLLTAHIGAGYDALTDDTSLTSNFVGGGAPFTTQGNKPDEWLGRAGVGTEIVAGDRIEVHVNYEYEYRDNFTDNLLAATLRWKI